MLVTLTTSGRELVDEALDAHVANERKLLDALSPTERRRLDTALHRLLDVLEH